MVKQTEERLRDRLASTVRKIRLSRDLSQRTLAKLAGLSLPFIGSVENGKRSCTVDTIEKLARALGVEVADLVITSRNVAHKNPDPLEPILALLRGRPPEKLQLAERVLRELFRPTETAANPNRPKKPKVAYRQGSDRPI